MKKRCNRKGYFFLIDSILALGVLVIGVFLVFSTYTKVSEKEGAALLSEDVMDFFASNKIKDINNEFGGLGGKLLSNGTITNVENTLLQQIGLFFANNDLGTAEDFIINLTENVIPPQFLFEVRIQDTLIFPSNPSEAHKQSKNDTAVLIPSQKIVYGISNKETGDMFGPFKAEVLVFQVS